MQDAIRLLGFLNDRHFGDNKIYAPPPIDLALERANGSFVRQQILTGKINAAHDISDGGLAVAISEMAMKSGLGATIKIPTSGQLHGWAFGENQARFVVSTADGNELIAAAKDAGIQITKIGMVVEDNDLKFGNCDTISVAEVCAVYESCIPSLMAG